MTPVVTHVPQDGCFQVNLDDAQVPVPLRSTIAADLRPRSGVSQSDDGVQVTYKFLIVRYDLRGLTAEAADKVRNRVRTAIIRTIESATAASSVKSAEMVNA